MVAAAVIPYATVGPDHDVSTDTENLMHEHMAFSFDSRASKGNRVVPNDEVAALAESDEPRVITVSLEDALKTDAEVDSYKVTAPSTTPGRLPRRSVPPRVLQGPQRGRRNRQTPRRPHPRLRTPPLPPQGFLL